MKLHEAMKKALLEFGVSVLRERRFFYLLSDYHAFEDCPAMKDVVKALSDGGYGEKLLLMSQEPGRPRYEACAREVRKFLACERHFKAEFAAYAVESVSFALGIVSSVKEPQDHGFDPLVGKNDAERGDMYAQYALGERYLKGDGLRKDGKEAAKWLEKAAGQGLDDAEYELGCLLADGQGVSGDLPSAVKWLTAAAKQGHAGAEFRLGSMCREGKGVPQDYAEAVRWLRLAAGHGSADAGLLLGKMYLAGEGAQDPAEAASWIRTLAEQGNAEAQAGLGRLSEMGQGIAPPFTREPGLIP